MDINGDYVWNRVGYARVSTEDQSLDLQLNALQELKIPPTQIFAEHTSGAAPKRPALQHALKHLRPGDEFIVWKLDRLGRINAEVTKMCHDFVTWGVTLKSITEGLDNSTPSGRLITSIITATGSYERDIIRERTVAGIKAAKERGTWRKRPPTIDEHQWAFMMALLIIEPNLSSAALIKHKDMPLHKKTRKLPMRTTVNNYMPHLRQGEPYPWPEWLGKKKGFG